MSKGDRGIGYEDVAGGAQGLVGGRTTELIIPGLSKTGRGVLSRIGATSRKSYCRWAGHHRPCVGDSTLCTQAIRSQRAHCSSSSRHRIGRDRGGLSKGDPCDLHVYITGGAKGLVGGRTTESVRSDLNKTSRRVLGRISATGRKSHCRWAGHHRPCVGYLTLCTQTIRSQRAHRSSCSRHRIGRERGGLGKGHGRGIADDHRCTGGTPNAVRARPLHGEDRLLKIISDDVLNWSQCYHRRRRAHGNVRSAGKGGVVGPVGCSPAHGVRHIERAGRWTGTRNGNRAGIGNTDGNRSETNGHMRIEVQLIISDLRAHSPSCVLDTDGVARAGAHRQVVISDHTVSLQYRLPRDASGIKNRLKLDHQGGRVHLLIINLTGATRNVIIPVHC